MIKSLIKQNEKTEENNLVQEPDTESENALPDPSRTLAAIDNLQRIIEQETEAISKADTQAFLAIQGDKIKAVDAYQNEMEKVKYAREAGYENLGLLLKEMKKRKKKFSEAVERNQRKLESITRGFKRLSGLLMESAKEEAKRQNTVCYSRNAATITGKSGYTTGVNQTA